MDNLLLLVQLNSQEFDCAEAGQGWRTWQAGLQDEGTTTTAEGVTTTGESTTTTGENVGNTTTTDESTTTTTTEKTTTTTAAESFSQDPRPKSWLPTSFT